MLRSSRLRLAILSAPTAGLGRGALVLGVVVPGITAGILFSRLPPQWLNVLSSLCFVLVATILTYRSAATARLVSPALIFVVTYLVQIYAGTVWLYVNEGISDPQIVGGGLLAFAIGTYAGGSHWWGGAAERGVRGSPLPTIRVWWAVLIGTAVIALVAYVAYRQVGIPLLSGQLTRSFEEFNGSTPKYTVVILYDLPIVLSLLLLIQSCYLRSRTWTTLAIGGAIFFSLIVIASSRRYPLFYMAIAWLVVLAQFQRRVNLRMVLAGIAGVALLLAGFTYVGLARSTGEVSTATIGYAGAVGTLVFQRILYSQAHVVAVILLTFPKTYPFFNGYTFSDEFLRLPGTTPQFDLGRFLYPLLFKENLIELGYAQGYAPPTLFGELYANFGTWVSIVLMGVIGVIMGLVERFARPWAAGGPVRLLLYAMIATFLGVASTEGAIGTFHSVLYAFGLVAIFVVAIPWLLAPRARRV